MDVVVQSDQTVHRHEWYCLFYYLYNVVTDYSKKAIESQSESQAALGNSFSNKLSMRN